MSFLLPPQPLLVTRNERGGPRPRRPTNRTVREVQTRYIAAGGSGELCDVVLAGGTLADSVTVNVK